MEDIPTPAPGADDVTIKILASPINPSDLNMVRQIYNNTYDEFIIVQWKLKIYAFIIGQIEGVYGIKPSSFPAVAGNEGVGIVTKVVIEVIVSLKIDFVFN